MLFSFKETKYLQLRGAAMGSNVAPLYANAFMNMIENSFFYGNVLFKENIRCWFCFIDSVFTVWEGDMDTLLLFHAYLNYLVPGLEFLISMSQDKLPFRSVRYMLNN